MLPTALERSVRIFISYAHEDQELQKKLGEHLSAMKRFGKVSIWQDQETPLGGNWDNQINTHLDEADIILLLVSASFIDSKYCWNETEAALKQHEAGTARVIPVILRPSDWQNTPLRQLQALPIGTKPITQWKDPDAALHNVAQGIRKVVEDLRKPSPLPKSSRQKSSRRTVVLGLAGIVTAVTGLTWLLQYARHPTTTSAGVSNFDTSMKGKWVATGSILQGRTRFCATTLKNGKVLIEGGDNSQGQFLTESELFDVATGNWTRTGSLNVGRSEHTATLLQDGRVLVVGGYAGPVLNSAELYDPARGTWIPSDSLSERRTRHTATLLKDGKVLVAGGWGRYGVPMESAEIYDPDAGRWSPAGKMPITRSDHIAVRLTGGKILVAGGAPENNTRMAEAELYDPTTNTWTATASMNVLRRNFTAILLPSGKVLVIGGDIPTGATASSELYDPATGHWSLTGGMKHARTGLFNTSALLFPDGRVLIAGGDTSGTSEIYMHDQGTWTALANIGQVYNVGATALLNDGRALIVGGNDGSSPSLILPAAIYTRD